MPLLSDLWFLFACIVSAVILKMTTEVALFAPASQQMFTCSYLHSSR